MISCWNEIFNSDDALIIDGLSENSDAIKRFWEDMVRLLIKRDLI